MVSHSFMSDTKDRKVGVIVCHYYLFNVMGRATRFESAVKEKEGVSE